MPEEIPNPTPTPVQTISGKEAIYDPVYKELGPNDKRPPRKIPVLKIIISLVALFFFGAILLVAIYLVKNQDKYMKIAQPAVEQVKAVLSPYPTSSPNICGYDAKICPGGGVTVKDGLKCEFIQCPDESGDMTKFWTITSSNQQTRTYENLDLKYKFTAPSNWTFLGKDSGFIFYSPNFECTNTDNCKGSSIQMTSSLTTGKSDIEEWYKSDDNFIAINSGKTPANLNNYIVTKVAGLKALETKDREDAKTFYFIQDNTVFVLDLKSSSDNDFINGSKELQKIVSSFSFTPSAK